MPHIRPCRTDEHQQIVAIINDAAQAYRGVIPPDCWHEPYFTPGDLEQEIAAGVRFSGYEADGALVGVIGLQTVQDVHLIRHAYVATANQHQGIGGKLLNHVRQSITRPVLVGTWADAVWAISFYQRHGFELVPAPQKSALLKRYWTISARQMETSVVLADQAWRSH